MVGENIICWGAELWDWYVLDLYAAAVAGHHKKVFLEGEGLIAVSPGLLLP